MGSILSKSVLFMTIIGHVLQLPWQPHSSIVLLFFISYFAFSASNLLRIYGEKRLAHDFPVQTFTII